MIWIYWESEPGVWTVGHYTPDDQCVTDSDHAEKEDAASRCSYLNGGIDRNLFESLIKELKEITNALYYLKGV